MKAIKQIWQGWLRAARMLAVAPILIACTGGSYPFLMVQLCLGDEANLAAFTREMQSIAAAESMRFIDGSEETRASLASIDKQGLSHDPGGPVIHMGVERDDGVGVTAANLGLNGYQVALGFSGGSQPADAALFARRVVDRLSERWRVQTVPAGQGAFPLPNCGGPSGADRIS